MSWKKITENDCHKRKLPTVDTWRSGFRSAMPAARQPPGGGPLMSMMPLRLHVNLKPNDDDDIIECDHFMLYQIRIL